MPILEYLLSLFSDRVGSRHSVNRLLRWFAVPGIVSYHNTGFVAATEWVVERRPDALSGPPQTEKMSIYQYFD